MLDLLQQISGNRFSDTGAADPDGVAVPADVDPLITFTGKRFCFTAKFAFGKRKDCAEAIENRGGFCDDDVTKALDYLVLGVGVSKDRKHEIYGRKIERAQQLRGAVGARPTISVNRIGRSR